MSTNPQQQNRSSLLCQEANFVKQNSDTRAWATDHTDQKGSFFAMLVVTTKLLDWVSLGTKCLCMQRIVGNKNKVECSSETTIQTSDIKKQLKTLPTSLIVCHNLTIALTNKTAMKWKN